MQWDGAEKMNIVSENVAQCNAVCDQDIYIGDSWLMQSYS